MVEIKLYTSEMSNEWNRFVDDSKNATFLHRREYMDYHSDRFQDCSLMAYSKGKLIAILPANRVENTLYSHQGLTYGGWLIPIKHFSIINMLEVFDAMKSFLKSIDITELIYKAIPHIYHTYPAEEDLYAIFLHGGELIETQISTTIEIENSYSFNSNSLRAITKAKNHNITVSESYDFKTYWDILSNVLKLKHDTKPVHSLEEIEMLAERFPNNIKLYTASQDNKMLAGVVIYESSTVAHAQYIASADEGRNKGALALLFSHLIENVYADKKYFDFGTSNEDHGRYLNEGLVMQKTGFGGRAIVHNIYKITL